MTKASDSWQLLFENFRISEKVLEDGYFDIEPSHFKKFHLEPRLLTKVDHSHQLADVMKKNGLSILTLSNSSWRIGTFDIFQKLPEWRGPDETVIHKALPNWLQSLKKDGITGEGALINAAEASGILEDFCDEELVATVTGKGRSTAFDFVINDRKSRQSTISVKNAQIEIDAGFEGQGSLCLFEAKKHLSLDFNIRQLYYPYRTWANRVEKPVRPIFITLANDIFDLHEFEFADRNNFSSIRLLKTKRYMLSSHEISEKELVQLAMILETQKPKEIKRKVPFPQADDFERVIDITEFVSSEPRSIDDITENYEFSSRQSDYYFSAARYLGLGELVKGVDGKSYRQITPLGQKIVQLPYAQKRKEMARLVLEIPSIRELYLQVVTSGRTLTVAEAEKTVVRYSESEGITGSTVTRRTQTMISWVNWLRSISRH